MQDQQLMNFDGPREECGVFGVYAPGREVARFAYHALYALQHRGQESAGIASAELGGYIMTQRALGLVSQAFTEHDLRALEGDLAVGHTRYSTTGGNTWENSQPVHRADQREIALAHNGNLVNAVDLHGELSEQGVTFRSTADSEIMAALLSTSNANSLEEAIVEVMPRLSGAFSTVVMSRKAVHAFRDPQGIRPLVIGRMAATDESAGNLSEAYVVASETCALDIIGAEFVREVAPGELVILDERGLTSRQVIDGQRHAFCVFEYIYFARPDSKMNGQLLQRGRVRMGEILARESPAIGADLVVPVPDSGIPAARGYSQASGIPMDDGFIKNRYVQRTFIQPGQELRKHGLRLKFNPLPEVIEGKSLVVVDDSIVRGNTTQQLVKMLREAGAREVHFRITAPPIRHVCHYGVDMSTREEMVAHERTVEEIRAHIGCDSLAYLSMDGVYEAVRGEQSSHCDACFSGNYPIEGTEQHLGKYALENALPMATGPGIN